MMPSKFKNIYLVNKLECGIWAKTNFWSFKIFSQDCFEDGQDRQQFQRFPKHGQDPEEVGHYSVELVRNVRHEQSMYIRPWIGFSGLERHMHYIRLRESYCICREWPRDFSHICVCDVFLSLPLSLICLCDSYHPRSWVFVCWWVEHVTHRN